MSSLASWISLLKGRVPGAFFVFLVYATMPVERREEIEREVIERMKKQVHFVYGRFERERREGKTIEQMSIIIRSTFLGLRNELLETGEKRLLPNVLKQTITG